MRLPFQPLETVYKAQEYRKRYQCLSDAMLKGSSSVGVLTAYIQEKLLEAKDANDMNVITENLTMVADDKEVMLTREPYRHCSFCSCS